MGGLDWLSSMGCFRILVADSWAERFIRLLVRFLTAAFEPSQSRDATIMVASVSRFSLSIYAVLENISDVR